VNQTRDLSDACSKGTNIRFVNYDEKEEATCINELTFLKFRPLMSYLVVPILSVLSAFILAICLYWRTNLRKKLLYKEVLDVNDATHILVQGREGNIEIIPIGKEKHVVFTYRFIKFEYIELVFRPVIFNANKS
jgi:hypothetical protein